MIEKLKKLLEDVAAMCVTTTAMGTPPVKAVGEPVGATKPKKKKKKKLDEEREADMPHNHYSGRLKGHGRYFNDEDIKKYSKKKVNLDDHDIKKLKKHIDEDFKQSLEEFLGHPIGKNRGPHKFGIKRSELEKYKMTEEEFRDSLVEQEAQMFNIIGAEKEDFRALCERRGFTSKEIAKLLVRMTELGIDCKGLV